MRSASRAILGRTKCEAGLASQTRYAGRAARDRRRGRHPAEDRRGCVGCRGLESAHPGRRRRHRCALAALRFPAHALGPARRRTALAPHRRRAASGAVRHRFGSTGFSFDPAELPDAHDVAPDLLGDPRGRRQPPARGGEDVRGARLRDRRRAVHRAVSSLLCRSHRRSLSERWRGSCGRAWFCRGACARSARHRAGGPGPAGVGPGANWKRRGRIGRGQRCVLVKRCKPDQDARFDLPSIGVSTVEEAAEAGLAGIALSAGETLLLGVDDIAAAARRHGVFVVGWPMRPDVAMP